MAEKKAKRELSTSVSSTTDIIEIDSDSEGDVTLVETSTKKRRVDRVEASKKSTKKEVEDAVALFKAKNKGKAPPRERLGAFEAEGISLFAALLQTAALEKQGYFTHIFKFGSIDVPTCFVVHWLPHRFNSEHILIQFINKGGEKLDLATRMNIKERKGWYFEAIGMLEHAHSQQQKHRTRRFKRSYSL